MLTSASTLTVNMPLHSAFTASYAGVYRVKIANSNKFITMVSK